MTMRTGRRGFLKLAGAAALLTCSASELLAGLLAKSFEAVSKMTSYPGPIKPLDKGEISKPGRWAG